MASICELEDTVAKMVKSSQCQQHQQQQQQQQSTPGKLVKPAWWPVDYHFPLKRHPAMSATNWRETLRNLVAKCYQFNNCERQRSKRQKSNGKHRRFRRNSSDSSIASLAQVQTNNSYPENKPNNRVSSIVAGRMRRDSTGSSVGSNLSNLSVGTIPLGKLATRSEIDVVRHPSGGDALESRSEISVAEFLTKNLGLAQKLPNRFFSPVVQVYDVCKVKPSFIEFDNNNIKYKRNENCDVTTKRDKKVEKNHFMNYFGLGVKSDDSVTSMLPKDGRRTNAKHCANKNNLVNCPHVPFSSNVGLKLMKDWHHYDNDVIEKRLERLERYLCNNDLPTLLNPIKDEFKVVINNKNSRVRLDHFYMFPTKKYHRRGKLTPKARFLLKNYCKPCFINLSTSGPEQIKNYLDNCRKQKINLIDTVKGGKQKENKLPILLLESRVVLTAIDKFIENPVTSSVVVKKVGQRSNFALQTLTPRNENLVVASTKPVQAPVKLVNFVNPTVVLQPIHELFEFAKCDKILHNSVAHNIARPPYNKVAKTRVNVYNPRRFSTRLHD